MLFQLKFPETGIVGSERISSFSDLVESQINFYNNYHYRILNHTVLQVLLLLPSWVFDFLNTLVFLILPLCLLRINAEQKDYGLKYLFLLSFIWIFHFNLGRSYFLTTGSLNYTWLLIPQLIYLSELLRWREGYGSKGLIFCMAMLNVNANENVLVVLFGISMMILGEVWFSRKAYLKEYWSVVVSALVLLVGGLFMLVSPSLDVRLEEQGFRSAGWISHSVEYSKRTIYYLISYLPIIVMGLVWRVEWRKWKSTRNLLLFLAIPGSLLVMVAVPLFEPRSAVFGFFVSMMWVVSLGKNCRINGWVVMGMMILATMVAVVRYPAFQEALSRDAYNKRLLLQETPIVELEPYCDRTKRSYLLCHQLSTEPEFIDNKSLAAVYGKAAVSLRRPELRNINSLEGFRKITESIFIKEPDQQGSTIIIKDERPNLKFILRGAKKANLKSAIISLLPENLQLYFLDYLEDVTQHQDKRITLSSGSYYQLYLRDSHAYGHLLLAEYDMEKHTRVGEVIEIELR